MSVDFTAHAQQPLQKVSLGAEAIFEALADVEVSNRGVLLDAHPEVGRKDDILIAVVGDDLRRDLHARASDQRRLTPCGKRHIEHTAEPDRELIRRQDHNLGPDRHIADHPALDIIVEVTGVDEIDRNLQIELSTLEQAHPGQHMHRQLLIDDGNVAAALLRREHQRLTGIVEDDRARRLQMPQRLGGLHRKDRERACRRTKCLYVQLEPILGVGPRDETRDETRAETSANSGHQKKGERAHSRAATRKSQLITTNHLTSPLQGSQRPAIVYLDRASPLTYKPLPDSGMPT
jgi:hypothetical protein